MRYTIDGLLQSKIIEYKISERERKLLEFIGYVAAGKNTVREQFGDTNYFWLNYSKFIAEYPYLGIPNTKQVGQHIKDLSAKGLIESHTERSPKGVFTYVAFTKKYYSLLSSNPENYDQTTAITPQNHCDSTSTHCGSSRSTLHSEPQSFGGENRSHIKLPTKKMPNKNNICTIESGFNTRVDEISKVDCFDSWLAFLPTLQMSNLSDNVKNGLRELANSSEFSEKSANEIRTSLVKLRMFLTQFTEQEVVNAIFYSAERGLNYIATPLKTKQSNQNQFANQQNQSESTKLPAWLEELADMPIPASTATGVQL